LIFISLNNVFDCHSPTLSQHHNSTTNKSSTFNHYRCAAELSRKRAWCYEFEFHQFSQGYDYALYKLNREGTLSPFLCVWLSNPLLNLEERLHIFNAVEQIKQVDSPLSVIDLINIIEWKKVSMGMSLLEFTLEVLMNTRTPDYMKYMVEYESALIESKNEISSQLAPPAPLIRVDLIPLIASAIGSPRFSFISFIIHF
jgi:hypothetical protein